MHRIDPKARIELKKLSIEKEDSKYIVGSVDTNVFVKVTPSVKKIFVFLRTKPTFAQLEYRFQDLDAHDFIENLFHHGFIHKIGDKIVHDKEHHIVKDTFPFISKKHVSWLFNPLMYSIYLIIIFSAVYILSNNSGYFPRYDDFFFIDTHALLIPISFVVGWIIVFMHEMAHLYGARSLGIRARIGLSNRLYFLVAITQLTGIYLVNRAKRYRTYLAGVVNDILVISVGVILLYLHDTGGMFLGVIGYKLVKFVILIELLGLLWQLMFFIKTDLYYVFETFFRIDNLQHKTKLFLRFLFKNLTKPIKHLTPYFESKKEVRLLFVYSLFYLVGVFLTIMFFVYYHIPILVSLVSGAILNIFNIVVQQTYTFYDSVITLMFVSINFSFLFYSLAKQHKFFRVLTLYVFTFLMMGANYSSVFLIILTLVLKGVPLVAYFILLFFLGFGFGILERKIFKSLVDKLMDFHKSKLLHLRRLTYVSPTFFFYFIILLVPPLIDPAMFYFSSTIAYIFGLFAHLIAVRSKVFDYVENEKK